jgi:hypothetical protein
MSREAEVAALLEADATLMAILTGGVYTVSELGREGITQDSAPGSFDSDGYLKPTAIVKQRGIVPAGSINDLREKIKSASQVVEIWLYQDTNFDAIDSAQDRIYTVLQGEPLTGTYEMDWAFTMDRMRDEGALNGASMLRIDFQVVSIRR